MQVKEIMTKNPYYADKNETIQQALCKMVEFDIRHLPILENDILIGIISDRDVRDYALPLSEDYGKSTEPRARLTAKVNDIMSSSVISIDENAELEELIDLMISEKLSAVPVVRSKTDRLVGIVSYLDVLSCIRELNID